MFWRQNEQFVDFQHVFPPATPMFLLLINFVDFLTKNFEKILVFGFALCFWNFFVKTFISQNWKILYHKPCSPQKIYKLLLFWFISFSQCYKWSKKTLNAILLGLLWRGRYPRGTIWLGRSKTYIEPSFHLNKLGGFFLIKIR